MNTHTHTRTDFFWGMYPWWELETRFARITYYSPVSATDRRPFCSLSVPPLRTIIYRRTQRLNQKPFVALQTHCAELVPSSGRRTHTSDISTQKLEEQLILGIDHVDMFKIAGTCARYLCFAGDSVRFAVWQGVIKQTRNSAGKFRFAVVLSIGHLRFS